MERLLKKIRFILPIVFLSIFMSFSLLRCGGASGGSSLPWNSYSVLFPGTANSYAATTGTIQDLFGVGITGQILQFTVSFWINFASTPSDQDAFVGTSTRNSWQDGFVFYWNAGDSTLRFGVQQWDQNVAIASGLTTGTWYHVVGVYDEGVGGNMDVRIYINGTLAGNDGLHASFPNFDEPNTSFGYGTIQVGAVTDNEGNAYIDEVAIWDEPLGDAEITEIYNGGTPFQVNGDQGNYSSSANLRGYWQLGDSSSYPTIPDIMGAYNLTLQNMSATDLSLQVP